MQNPYKFLLLSVLVMMLLACAKEHKTPAFAATWAFAKFEKADAINPILLPSAGTSFTCPISQKAVNWESRNVLNPAAVVKDGKVFLFYRAQDSSGTSRIGMAISEDGLRFKRLAAPVLFPDKDSLKIYEWNYKKQSGTSPQEENCKNCYFDGVEDPRIVESEQGVYIMTYTSYDGKTARLCVATSTDLTSWQKHGPALKDKKYVDLWSKSGAIVAAQQGEKMVAKKIKGKYWMYFGDTHIFLANSDDLIHWQVCENEESKEKISVLHPRMGYFDSRLVEPGPYALYKKEGILLIYNGSNAANFNDPALPRFTYAAGQALFDKENPHKLITRTNNHFIYPDKAYEKIGEVNEVCFVEGLVYFKNKWLLYYGTADSKIAVAVNHSAAAE